MSGWTANDAREFIDGLAEAANRKCYAALVERDALIAELEAQVGRMRERLLEWHSTHGWEDNRSRADSFADCTHVICVNARAALKETP